MLALLAEVGDEGFTKLLAEDARCTVLWKGTTIGLWMPPGLDGIPLSDAPAVSTSGVIRQISHLGKFLDSSVPVGGSWSGNAMSFSHQPLKSAMTVESDSESVTVPAGHFERCLLMELVTKESDLPDDALDRNKDLNRRMLVGTRRVWFAPGVGLVQLHVRTAEDKEALIQLEQFTIGEPSADYLPLAIGNSWVYGWACIPNGYVAKESYRVGANEGDLWYLEHYEYAYQR
jgi:hypothetical protein